ncbi:MAG: FecR family protein [Acidobacteriales bacterium]|nr:FecR family protein [Terriglobales bacterium]
MVATNEKKIGSALRRALALFLATTIATLPAAQAAPQQDDPRFEPVGVVTGTSELAVRNNVTLHRKDKVNARDVLATNREGRVRLLLEDGSRLSLGSNTRVTLLRHDRKAHETHLDVSMGTLRSQITEFKKDGGFFQLTTPHSNLTVVGTDFSVEVNPTRTRVVVYSGIVAVKPRDRDIAVSVAAGQNIEVNPSGIGGLQLTSDDVERETIAATTLDGENLPQADVVEPASSGITAREGGSNKKRFILIGVAAGAAAAVGLALASRSTDNSGRRRSIPDR